MSVEFKDPAEIITVTFAFADELGTANISAVDSVTIAVVTGADPDSAAMLNGAGAISGGDVLQSIRAGVAGADYKLRALAALSDGRKLVRALNFPVRTR